VAQLRRRAAADRSISQHALVGAQRYIPSVAMWLSVALPSVCVCVVRRASQVGCWLSSFISVADRFVLQDTSPTAHCVDQLLLLCDRMAGVALMGVGVSGAVWSAAGRF